MLRRLRIKDFALIENLDLDFQYSMVAITGESGSGKSLILDALSSILGGKCNTMNIRSGAKRYQIEAIFDIAQTPEVKDWLDSRGIPFESNELILRKELNLEGKSRVQINTALAPTQYLREVGGLLAEIHRQNEQIVFLEKEKQLELLDLYAGLEKEKKEFRNVFHSYRSLKTKLQEMEMGEWDKQRKMEIYRFQVDEIERAGLSETEEANLLQEEKVLVHSEKIVEHLGFAANVLSAGEEGVVLSLGKVLHSVEKISTLRPEYAALSEDLHDIYQSLKEVHSGISEELEDIDYSFERLSEVQKRLDEISRFKKKFGKSISEILDYKEKIQLELDSLESSESIIAELRQSLDRERQVLSDLSTQLSNRRRQAISDLESSLQKELGDLGMKDSKLQIVMRWESSPEGDIMDSGKRYFVTENGLDHVDFYFSANPGEKPRPLRKIISGGEVSRVMLGFKKILGRKDRGKLLLFDEIDTGIGGEAALQVATKIQDIAKNHQIFVITHQQAIAAASREQVVVEKLVLQGRTVSQAQKLTDSERPKELAKMIAGNQITQGALDHAKELLKKVAI